jgi:serine/threonine-protein kinase
MAPDEDVKIIGRYALYGELASGGMAAVHLGRLLGPVGFTRTVAIKRLHSHHARDPEFVKMFLDEARIVARIKHPNVVPTLDVVALEGELFLVMEYVHGTPIGKVMVALSRRKERMPVNVAVGICVGILEGLHAAHEAKSEEGTPLLIVHRDVSPQNVIVGADGIARVLDFGIAKAAERLQTTDDGSFKGKLGYMSPEVLSDGPVDRRADLWAAAIVLWEMLVGKRLFGTNESPHALVRAIVENEILPPSSRGVETSPALDAVILRALTKDPDARFATAREMASALENATPVASSRVIGEWLASVVGEQLEERAALVERMERSSRAQPPSLGTVRSLTESGSLPELPPTPSSGSIVAAAPHAPTSSSGATSAEIPAVSVVPDVPSPLAPLSPERPPPRRRRRAFAVVLVALLIVGLGEVGVRVLRQSVTASQPTTSSIPDAPTRATAIPSTTRTTSTTSATSTAPSASVALEPTPNSSGAAPTSSTASAVSAQVQATAKASQARAGTPPPKSCNPPYTIGPPPDYIRRPKLECLAQ